jgi:hypothetical protein
MRKMQATEKQIEYALLVHEHNNRAVVAPAVTISILSGGYEGENEEIPGCLVFNEKKWTLLGSIHYNGEYFSTSACFDSEKEAEEARPAMEQMLRMRDLGQKS